MLNNYRVTRHITKEYVNIFFLYIFSCSLLLGVVLCHFIIFKRHVPDVLDKVDAKENLLGKVSPLDFSFDSSFFNDLNLEAKSYVVYDIVNHKIIASKNEGMVLPLASITKVMMAISASLHKPLDSLITISPQIVEGRYDLGLQKNQVWELSELLKYTLVFSSNDGAKSIANSFGSKNIFLLQMNNDAKELGLHMVFTDPAGLDIGGEIGGKGTALQVAEMLRIARENIPEIMDATTKKRVTVSSIREKVRGIPNTNQDVDRFFGIESSKTGYTDLAGGNLVIIVDVALGRPVVLVVLGSSREGRFKDMRTLYEVLQKSILKK